MVVDILVIPVITIIITKAFLVGYEEIDQIILVLLKTNMFVGGLLGFVLDNTMPGTPEERGLIKWRARLTDESGEELKVASVKIYDLPFGLNKLRSFKICKYLPFMPYHSYKPAADAEMSVIENQNTAM